MVRLFDVFIPNNDRAAISDMDSHFLVFSMLILSLTLIVAHLDHQRIQALLTLDDKKWLYPSAVLQCVFRTYVPYHKQDFPDACHITC